MTMFHIQRVSLGIRPQSYAARKLRLEASWPKSLEFSRCGILCTSSGAFINQGLSVWNRETGSVVLCVCCISGTDSWSCEPDYALYVLPRCGEVVVVKAYEVVNSASQNGKLSDRV